MLGMKQLNLLACLICFLASGSAEAQDSLLLINAKIFDVVKGKLDDRPQSILISGNRIVDVSSTLDLTADDVIDLQGRVVLPGLIDLHSRLLLHPYNDTVWDDQALKEPVAVRTIRATVAANQTLAAGFTTIRDLGTAGAGLADVALRDSIDQGIIPGPRLYVATKALAPTGGYEPMGFDPRWEIPIGVQNADGVTECRKATREQIAAGADWIKIYADYRRRPDAVATPTFSQSEIDAIVDEARSANVPVAAQATTDIAISRCLKAGVKTIEHGYDASPETLETMRKKGVILCPTLSAAESISVYQGWDPKNDPDPPRIQKAKTLIKNAMETGVMIGCGSNAGVFPHGQNSRELELMFAYGMSVEDALRSATVIAANVLGQSYLGQVGPKFVADLIVLDENPVDNIFTLQSPRMVIKNGEVVIDQLSSSTSTTNPSLTNQNPLTSGVVEETIQLGSNKELGKLIRQLDMASPNIQTEPENAPIPSKPEIKKAGQSQAAQFEFQLNKDGTFSLKNEPIARGDLARFIARQLEADRKTALVSIASGTSEQNVEKTKAWLNRLGVTSVRFVEP